MNILLPAQINPPRIRKDGSCSVSFDTRELNSEEIFTIMSLRNSEGWLAFGPNPDDVEIPEEEAHVEGKSIGERLRAVLFVLFKQETEAGSYTGVFDSFYKEHGEKLIEFIKRKLEN